MSGTARRSAGFEEMWRDLLPVGRRAGGGYHRLPWTSAERELRAWFTEAARARGLAVERDGLGNLVAWWRPAAADAARERAAEGASVLTGSHLDSVADGGAYDGPLGVGSGLAAVDALRERGFRPARPLGVAAFVAEEGSRYGVACLGSRLLTGATSWEQARMLRDGDGVLLEDAVAADGLDGSRAPLLDGVGCFVELHVEQGRDLVDRGAAVALAGGIRPHGRYRFDFAGEANHAGTTRMADRRDPMLTYAMTVLAANKRARLAGQRATFGRVEVHPGGTNAVAGRVTAWLDARADSAAALDRLVGEVRHQAEERAARDGTAVLVTTESLAEEVAFDAALARRVGGPAGWPVIPTMAGHDAGVLQAAGIPSAMLFVRNPTGVSHSPAEHADTADCLAGVAALADTLALLAS